MKTKLELLLEKVETEAREVLISLSHDGAKKLQCFGGSTDEHGNSSCSNNHVCYNNNRCSGNLMCSSNSRCRGEK